MLIKAHRVYHWDRQSNSISSDRLEDECLPILRRAIAVYRGHIADQLGRVLNNARRALEALTPDRIEAEIHQLDHAATNEWPGSGRQAEQRLRVFESAAPANPILDPEMRRAILESTLGVADGGGEAVARLYADYPEFHRLAAFPPEYSAARLRDDYDLAQTQALLYDATAVQVEANADLKYIVQYAHLSRLLHRIERVPGNGYRLTFDGPNSVLRRTHEYGVDFAKFLAALVQVRDWRMRARIDVHKRGRPSTLVVSSEDNLRSRVPPPALFDSGLEERFARKFGAARDGWRLNRETLLLEAGTSLLVPDFTFVHEDGTEVALEIVGYWTPEYLARKFGKLAMVRGVNLIVAVRKQWTLAAGAPPPWALSFKTTILLKDLLPRLEALRPRPASVNRPPETPRAGRSP